MKHISETWGISIVWNLENISGQGVIIITDILNISSRTDKRSPLNRITGLESKQVHLIILMSKSLQCTTGACTVPLIYYKTIIWHWCSVPQPLYHKLICALCLKFKAVSLWLNRLYGSCLHMYQRNMNSWTPIKKFTLDFHCTLTLLVYIMDLNLISFVTRTISSVHLVTTKEKECS